LPRLPKPPLPHQLTAPVRYEVELVQEMLERAFAPLDAVFDLLEQSGAALHRQAEALNESARALERAAAMMETQAELFEHTIHALRQPTTLAKSVTGLHGKRDA
jgi:hypothetical protein